MLKQVVSVGLAGLLLALCPAPSFADQVCTKLDNDTGTCLIWVEVPESGGGDASEANEGAQGGEPDDRTCSFRDSEIQCQTAFGTWSDLAQGWCRKADPQPPLDHVAWGGHTDGSVYACVRPNGSLVPDPGLTLFRWLPSPPAAVTQADAAAAARRVLASLGLTAVDLGIQPRGDTTEHMAYVGWNTWLWAESPSSTQWGPVHASATDSGIAVTLDAEVTGLTWDMGDGATVTCQRGTEWTAARTQGGRNIASPDCGHVYEEDGRYTVTATSDWRVGWSAAGFTGSIPLTLSRSADVIVGELQSVGVS